MVEFNADPVPVCQTTVNVTWEKAYFISLIIVFFFIPLLILVLLYIYIARHLVPAHHAADDGERVRY